MAMSTIEVGVETFSLIRNNRLRIENEQISTPLPEIAENMPPMKPVIVKMKACPRPKLGIESKVLRLCCLKKNFYERFFVQQWLTVFYLLSRNRAKAKLNQMHTNPNFLVGGSRSESSTSRPKIMPNMAPKLQKIIECHSSWICIQNIVKAAAVIPSKER